MIKVGVQGALGKMGQEIINAVSGDSDLELIAGIDPLVENLATHGFGINIVPDLKNLERDSIDVLIDFTTAASVRSTMEYCSGNSVNLVVGTSGITQDDINCAHELFDSSDKPNIVIASNFAIGDGH